MRNTANRSASSNLLCTADKISLKCNSFRSLISSITICLELCAEYAATHGKAPTSCCK